MSSGINAFDRLVINPRERPASSDINALQSRADQSLRAAMRGLFIPHNKTAALAGTSGFTPLAGFFGDSFFPTAPGSNRIVTLNPGLGFLLGAAASSIGGISGLDDLDAYFPAYLPAALPITIDAPPGGGQERYDLIEVKQDRRIENPSSRDVLNTSTGIFEPLSVDKTFAYMLDTNRLGRIGPGGGDSTMGISYKVGTAAAAGTGAPPATTTGYTAIAVVYSLDGVTNVRQQDIRDDRGLLLPGGVEPFAFSVLQMDGTPDIVVASGPGINAGLRVAARSLSSPGGAIKVLILGGSSNVDPTPLTAVLHAQILPNPSGSNFLLAKVSTPGPMVLSAAEAALIAAQVKAFGDAASIQGQYYNEFTISRAVVSGSDGSSRTYYISGVLIRE